MTMNTTPLSRRNFLGTSGAALAGFHWSAESNLHAAGANDRLSAGIVGAGQRGEELIRYFCQVRDDYQADLTAVCDLWKHHRERGAGQEGKAGDSSA